MTYIKETVERLRATSGLTERRIILERKEAADTIERLAGALEEVRQKSVWADASAIPRINEIARRALSGEPT